MPESILGSRIEIHVIESMSVKELGWTIWPIASAGEGKTLSIRVTSHQVLAHLLVPTHLSTAVGAYL